MSNVPSNTAPDPHDFGASAVGLSEATKARAKAAVVAAATQLHDNEVVHALVCGEFLANAGVAVMTNQRVLLANSRTFNPEFESIPLGNVEDVKGWADAGRATLRITGAGKALILGDIKEIDGAQAFAAALRSNI